MTNTEKRPTHIMLLSKKRFKKIVKKTKISNSSILFTKTKLAKLVDKKERKTKQIFRPPKIQKKKRTEANISKNITIDYE